MKICDFTLPECRHYLTQCNFTEDEELLFNLRAHDIPLEECAEIMNVSISTVKQKSQKINKKINKINKLCTFERL